MTQAVICGSDLMLYTDKQFIAFKDNGLGKVIREICNSIFPMDSHRSPRFCMINPFGTTS